MINESQNQTSVVFYTPGSNYTEQISQARRPIYNQTMGILNLMEPPVMHRAQGPVVPAIPTPEGAPVSVRSAFSLKLASPLRYALNPASSMQLNDIRAALYFYNCAVHVHEEKLKVQAIMEGTGLVEEEAGVWRTPYMPVACLDAYTVSLPPLIDFPNVFCDTDIQLHLIAKLTSPAGKETAWAARYRVNTAPAPYTYENTPPNPYLHVQENVEVNNLEEIISSGIQAWNPVDIVVTRGPVEDFLNSLTPQSVSIYDPSAPTYYIPEFYPGQFIPAPFTVNRVPNCGSNPPMSAADLDAICQNQMRYNPILSLSRPLEEDIADGEDEPALPLQAPGATLSPNPVRDQAWLDYHVAEEGPVSIVVSDHAGRRVLSLQAQVQHAKGAYRAIIPVGELPAGIYFVSVIRHTGVEALKLLKL